MIDTLRDTSTITLTDAQWALLLADTPWVNGFTVEDFNSVHNVLIRAHNALRENLFEDDERRIDAITDIQLWYVADGRNDDFLLAVNLAHRLTLQSDLINMVDLKDTANATPGEPAIRAVFSCLIAERNEMCEAFALAALEFEGLVGYAEHRGIRQDDLYDTVHDVASEHASATNNNGLGTQIPYLIEQYGHGNTRDLIDEIAADKASTPDATD
ncbi:hypothetical protein AB0F17_43280 [Nonomuraea sp. NPDC026600]|uniref:hypothetical protein n=1 Tax=Nonomuraea sp. NPDC026600 TaxID=3155363 RepID=UPI0033E82FB4